MFTRVSLVLAVARRRNGHRLGLRAPPPIEELAPKKPEPTATPFPQVGTVVALNGRDETDRVHRRRARAGAASGSSNRERTTAASSVPTGGTSRWIQADTEGEDGPAQVHRRDRQTGLDGRGLEAADDRHQLLRFRRRQAGVGRTPEADRADALVVVDFDNVILDRLVEELQIRGHGPRLLEADLPDREAGTASARGAAVTVCSARGRRLRPSPAARDTAVSLLQSVDHPLRRVGR